jgi:YD repeat-containing protein
LTQNGTTETRGYLYYGNQLIEETKNGSTLAMYGWDQQGLISRTDANGNSIFYLWDGLGNCIGIIDQDGRLAQSYEYSAFGECLSGKDAVNAFRYVGRYGGMQDDETGLTYFWRLFSQSSG